MIPNNTRATLLGRFRAAWFCLRGRALLYRVSLIVENEAQARFTLRNVVLIESYLGGHK